MYPLRSSLADMNISIKKVKSLNEFGSLSKHLTSRFVAKIHQHWQDILLVVFLGTLAAFAAYQGAQQVNPVIVDKRVHDVWFESDVPRIFQNMSDRMSNHFRNKVHPLFSLIAFPPTLLLTQVFNLESLTAVRIVIAAVAFLWLGTLFILLRLIGCRRFDAMLFSGLAATSAAAMFWFVVPETYSFGSLSILLALCFVVITQHRQLSSLWYVAASTLTLSFTITNWMTGILATIVNHPIKRALRITVAAFCLVFLLSIVQFFIFPSSRFIFLQFEEHKYVMLSRSGGLLHVLKSFIAHTMVMPALIINADKYAHDPSHWPILSTQFSDPGSGSLWGLIAVGLWTALLGLGLWGFFSTKQHFKLRIVLGLTLLGQLILHSLYGDETFLYSLHFAPLLVVLAAFSTLTRARPIALLLTAMLVVTAGMNNYLQFHQAIAFVEKQAPQRYQVLGEMQKRPKDPWARGTGHVVLAVPGSREVDKAYHEPGGSFSPAVSSFGVSIWLPDGSGRPQTTSDNIPLSEIEQQLSWSDGRQIPGILTKTKDYQAQWSATNPNGWQLHLKTQANSATKPMLAIRSIGPAGGPINSLNWDGKRLLVNDRWSVALTPTPAKVYLGEEGPSGWMNERSDLAQWQGKSGWGYARFELANGSDWNLDIKDFSLPQSIDQSPAMDQTNWTTTKAAIDLNLPDKQFSSSLNAQVAHLMMGTVGRETRPGEPTNYPLAWQRDGAYEVVALARAGQLQVAKELSTDFAEKDFFGGFGAEADAPGLSIWALEEVALRLKQPEYDRFIWPHMHRKAEFILEMMTTTKPIRRSFDGPVVPLHAQDPELTLVAEPAKDNLIIGRMDNHRPLLFVNAVNYRGLMDAADLADRLKQPAEAKRWRTAAAKLQKAWEKTFQASDSIDDPNVSPLRSLLGLKRSIREADNDRTYISSLWPTWVAAPQKAAFTQALQARWQKHRDDQGGFRKPPLWTYFDLAEAHQWLFVDQPKPLWKTLEWFWNNQASPGLYTWWEGNGEENSFGRWEKVRGWVKPQHVAPHYWTAAEMLLLQLDMLAYTDMSSNSPTIVIGAGIPQDWLRQTMSVRGLPMPNGKLDWQWDGQQMRVKISGDAVNIRLGSMFPAGTPLKVEYSQAASVNAKPKIEQ